MAFRASRITARAAEVVVRVIPIGTPFADLASHAADTAPAHIPGIALRWCWPFHLRHVGRQPARWWELPARATTASVEPQAPVVVGLKRASCHLISTPARPRVPVVPPREDAALGATGGVLPFGLSRQPCIHPCAVGEGVVPRG